MLARGLWLALIAIHSRGTTKYGVAEPKRSMYLERQDDDFLQPILVYVPLLAHGSGIGGVGSSERLLSFS